MIQPRGMTGTPDFASAGLLDDGPKHNEKDFDVRTVKKQGSVYSVKPQVAHS